MEEGQTAIELNPYFAIGYENLGFAYVHLNRLSEAEALLRKASERKIHFDSSTKWTQGSKTVDMSEFKEGSDVICLGGADEKGEFHATRIDLRRQS